MDIASSFETLKKSDKSPSPVWASFRNYYGDQYIFKPEDGFLCTVLDASFYMSGNYRTIRCCVRLNVAHSYGFGIGKAPMESSRDAYEYAAFINALADAGVGAELLRQIELPEGSRSVSGAMDRLMGLLPDSEKLIMFRSFSYNL